MRPRVKKTGLAIAAIAGLIVTTLTTQACREPTQVTLDITYGGPCKEIGGVGLIIGTDPYVAESRIETNVLTTSVGRETCTDGAPSRIGTLVITPNDSTGRASIVVFASFGKSLEQCKAKDGYFGCIVARRAFAFVDHAKLTLVVSLDPECKNVPCDAISTCRKGSCVDSSVDCSSGTCATPGDPGDGGFVTVDAPTTSDQYVQGDAPKDAPLMDGPIDSPPDARDAPGVCETKSALLCDVTGSTAMCGAGQYCCYGVGASPVAFGASASAAPEAGVFDAMTVGGYACRAPASCDASSNGGIDPVVQCRSAQNCGAGQRCCYQAFNSSTATICSSAPCLVDAGAGDAQACKDDCECPSGKCGPATRDIGMNPKQTITLCAP